MFIDTTISPTFTTWILAYIAIFLLGVSKAGLKGLSIFNVTLLALAFGSKPSTGILLPLLVVGDTIAVIYYNRHAQWQHLLKILPWMLLGVLFGVAAGKDLPEKWFTLAMVVIIFGCLAILVFWDQKASKTVPKHWLFAASTGVLGGITTMIGNLAGPIANIYFLALRLPKNAFVGTAAWLFFITNMFKVPFHAFVWKTITTDSLWLNLKLLPALLIGFVVGAKTLNYFNDHTYRRFILIVTAIGALAILFK